MEVKVKLRAITIKDENTGEEYTVLTVRTAEDVARYLEESERDETGDKLREAVSKAYEEYWDGAE